MTLAFIGSVGEEQVAAVVAAAGAAAAGTRPFRVDLDVVGRYPEGGPIRVVWAGTTGAAGAIEALGGAVRAELGRRRIPFDARPLRPHVTLARVREDAAGEQARAIASALAAIRIPDGLGFGVTAIEVVDSVLSRDGPRYAARARPALGRDERGRA